MHSMASTTTVVIRLVVELRRERFVSRLVPGYWGNPKHNKAESRRWQSFIDKRGLTADVNPEHLETDTRGFILSQYSFTRRRATGLRDFLSQGLRARNYVPSTHGFGSLSSIVTLGWEMIFGMLASSFVLF